jgi:(1->4)-alpha-D-glucan 1-alpha-D-glucosylmutase
MLRGLLGRVNGDRLELVRDLLGNKEDGRVKLFVTAMALRWRRDNRDLFSTGAYLPLETTGPKHEHIFAFARRQAGRTALIAVPRLLTRLSAAPDAVPLGPECWGETRLVVPEDGPARYRNLFTGEKLNRAAEGLSAAAVFAAFPVALLVED